MGISRRFSPLSVKSALWHGPLAVHWNCKGFEAAELFEMGSPAVTNLEKSSLEQLERLEKLARLKELLILNCKG